MYFCKHNRTLEYRCVDCDEEHKFLPTEWATKIRVWKALETEITEALEILEAKDHYGIVDYSNIRNLLRVLKIL